MQAASEKEKEAQHPAHHEHEHHHRHHDYSAKTGEGAMEGYVNPDEEALEEEAEWEVHAEELAKVDEKMKDAETAKKVKESAEAAAAPPATAEAQ